MKVLRLFFSLSALLAGVSLFAQAPDSLAGKTFHEHSDFSVNKSTYATITQLKPDGTCTYIRVSIGDRLNLQAAGVEFITTPPADGTWSYTKTGTSTGLLVIDEKFVAAAPIQKSLVFNSPTGGEMSDQTGSGGNFTLTDKPTADAAPLFNVSLRGHVAPGSPLIAGFVVPGTDRRDFLIRVVGPSLSQFGVNGTWADPDFSVVPASPNKFLTPEDFNADAYYADWSAPSRQTSDPTKPQTNPTNPAAGFKKIFNYVGAFPLLDGSKDAAQVINLGAGAYSVVCTAPAGDVGGDVLIEIYYLP